MDPSFVPNPHIAAPDGDQNVRIRPGSPLAVIGLFVEVIRARYQPAVMQSGSMPWVWDADIKKTKIAIESAYVEDQEHRNFKPAIFVDVDSASYGRTVTGDRAAQVLATSQEAFFGLDSMPVLIECISAKRGEAYVIGDVTRVFLQASSDLIQAAFGLHEMTPLTLNRPQPHQKDKDTWVASITFTVQIPARWTSKPTKPLLQEIVTKIKNSSALDGTEYFTQIALPPR